MQILNELFEIISLLFSIAAHKTVEVLNKVKARGQQYLRILKWLIAIAIIVPLILMILGIVLKSSWLIGCAGIILALATLAFVSLTAPLISLVETIYRFFRKSENADSETLARRFINGVNTVLLSELIATLYFVLIPWETNPGIIFPLFIAMFILFILAIRNWGAIAGLIRFTAFIIAFSVLVFSTLTFVLPKTMGEIKKSVPTIDEKMQKKFKNDVSGLFEDKPQPSLESSVADSENPAQAAKPVQDSSSPNKAAVQKKTQTKKVTSSSMKRPRGIFAWLTDAGNGEWKDFRVPGNIKDAVPTNIKVQRGDSIDFDVTGKISASFRSDRQELKEGPVGPEGTWPTWMTQAIYHAEFIEFESNICWNPVFRIGSDPKTQYFATHTNSTHIARTDGLIWLRINDNPSSNVNSMNDSFEGEFNVALRIRPANQIFRDSLEKMHRDSIELTEKRLRDSLLVADRAFQNMVHHDSIQGWTTIRFSLSVPEAYPTNIFVERGDSIEIITQGSAMLFLRNRKAWDAPWLPWEPHILTPMGIWPLWMTAQQYGYHFKETMSRKCWNLCLRIGPDARGQLHNIGQKANYHIVTPGDIWLKMNRSVDNDIMGDSLSGEFIVKIRIIHPSVDSSLIPAVSRSY